MSNWPELISAVFGAAAGYFIKFYLDRRKEMEDRAFSDKREHYRNLILCLKKLREGKFDDTEFLWFEYSFLWLHAPDSVIKSANTLLEKINIENANSDELASCAGDLLLEIRRDMGFSKTKLRRSDFKGKLSNGC